MKLITDVKQERKLFNNEGTSSKITLVSNSILQNMK